MNAVYKFVFFSRCSLMHSPLTSVLHTLFTYLVHLFVVFFIAYSVLNLSCYRSVDNKDCTHF